METDDGKEHSFIELLYSDQMGLECSTVKSPKERDKSKGQGGSQKQ